MIIEFVTCALINFFFFGFMVCAVLTANHRNKELSLGDLPTESEDEDE